jgi:hypothetical protein
VWSAISDSAMRLVAIVLVRSNERRLRASSKPRCFFQAAIKPLDLRVVSAPCRLPGGGPALT